MFVTNPLASRTMAREQIRHVARGLWTLLFVGIVSTIASGLIPLIDWSVDDLTLFLGTLLVVSGLLTMLSVPLDGSAPTRGDTRTVSMRKTMRVPGHAPRGLTCQPG